MKVRLKCIKLQVPLTIVSSDLKTSRVFVFSFIREEENVLPVCSFEHHVPRPYCIHIELVSDTVNTNMTKPYSVVNVFENTQK